MRAEKVIKESAEAHAISEGDHGDDRDGRGRKKKGDAPAPSAAVAVRFYAHDGPMTMVRICGITP